MGNCLKNWKCPKIEGDKEPESLEHCQFCDYYMYLEKGSFMTIIHVDPKQNIHTIRKKIENVLKKKDLSYRVSYFRSHYVRRSIAISILIHSIEFREFQNLMKYFETFSRHLPNYYKPESYKLTEVTL